MRALGAGLCLGVALVALAEHAAVAEPAADVESLIRQGVALRRKGEDAKALGYFDRAYELAPTPRSAAQLGLAELAVKNYARGEELLTEALGSNDPWVEEHASTMEQSRTAARAHLLRVVIVGAPEGATFAAAGGGAVHPLPTDGVLWIAPQPPSTLRLEAPGHSATVLHVDGAAGGTRRVVVQMPAVVEPPKAEAPTAEAPKAEAVKSVPLSSVPAPPAPEGGETPSASPEPVAPHPGRALRIAGIAVAATGVAAAVVGGIVYAQGVSRRDDYRNAINAHGTYDPRYGSWETWRDAGDGLLIGGGVAVVAGAGLYALGRHARNAENGSTVSFLPGPGLGVLSYRGSF